MFEGEVANQRDVADCQRSFEHLDADEWSGGQLEFDGFEIAFAVLALESLVDGDTQIIDLQFDHGDIDEDAVAQFDARLKLGSRWIIEWVRHAELTGDTGRGDQQCAVDVADAEQLDDIASVIDLGQDNAQVLDVQAHDLDTGSSGAVGVQCAWLGELLERHGVDMQCLAGDGQ